MFTQAILPDALGAIEKIYRIPEIKNAYLAGGTALALHLGHRISEDLDFFTAEEFDASVLATELTQVKGFNEDRQAWRTVLGRIGKTRFSIFYYQYSLLTRPVEFKGIRLAGKPDIAPMKLKAIGDRGTKRDFIDMYFLSQEYSMDKILDFYNRKYGDMDEKMPHILKSLAYFEDAEADQLQPRMLVNFDWGGIKKFFMAESMRLAKEKLGL